MICGMTPTLGNYKNPVTFRAVNQWQMDAPPFPAESSTAGPDRLEPGKWLSSDIMLQAKRPCAPSHCLVPDPLFYDPFYRPEEQSRNRQLEKEVTMIILLISKSLRPRAFAFLVPVETGLPRDFGILPRIQIELARLLASSISIFGDSDFLPLDLELTGREGRTE